VEESGGKSTFSEEEKITCDGRGKRTIRPGPWHDYSDGEGEKKSLRVLSEGRKIRETQ